MMTNASDEKGRRMKKFSRDKSAATLLLAGVFLWAGDAGAQSASIKPEKSKSSVSLESVGSVVPSVSASGYVLTTA